MNQELTVISKQEIAPPQAGGITIEQAFRAATSGEIDEKSLAVMQQLLAMDAARLFNAAFVKLQSELPTIVAESVIPNRGKYARFEHVWQKVSGPLRDNGFCVSFSQDNTTFPNKVVCTCDLMHSAGHSKKSSYGVRVGGKADSDTQADCKASTTAKRNALLQCLNIVVSQDVLQDEDGDATLAGDINAFVTQDQADELERRCHETNSNVIDFLKYAGGKTFATIPASKYDTLDSLLAKKERQGR